jgi:hypothetical protein
MLALPRVERAFRTPAVQHQTGVHENPCIADALHSSVVLVNIAQPPQRAHGIPQSYSKKRSYEAVPIIQTLRDMAQRVSHLVAAFAKRGTAPRLNA